jgi:hypothetical protein
MDGTAHIHASIGIVNGAGKRGKICNPMILFTFQNFGLGNVTPQISQKNGLNREKWGKIGEMQSTPSEIFGKKRSTSKRKTP